MIDCAVVIVNYNAGPLLQEAARSALAEGACEVVVVDNASVDGSADDLIAVLKDENVRLIRNSENRGFAAGCNVGVRATGASAVLFLNPDCRLEHGALAKLFEVLNSAADIGMVGPLLLNPDGSEQRGGRRKIPTPMAGFAKGFRLNFLGRILPTTFGDFNQHGDPIPAAATQVEAISGGAMMVKRQAIDAVGLWDEGYFLHVEDIDYCKRFAIGGWRILFVPGARAVHVQGVSSRARPWFVEWHKHQGMVRFYGKFFARDHSAIMVAFVKSGVWLRFGVIAGLSMARRLASRRPR
jgi:GT2 family glycosyltransferase